MALPLSTILWLVVPPAALLLATIAGAIAWRDPEP